MNPLFLETARLLTQVAPLVFVDDTFALKGGTAIEAEVLEILQVIQAGDFGVEAPTAAVFGEVVLSGYG